MLLLCTAHTTPHASLPLLFVLPAPQHAYGAFSPRQDLICRAHRPRWPQSTRATPFSCSGFPLGSHPFFFRPAVSPSCLQRITRCPHASAPAPASALRHARSLARTHALGRPTTNDATCGPPAWLTGTPHEEGLRSVRSPLRRPPLLATPIASPLQGGRPERSGLLFLKLLVGLMLDCQRFHGGTYYPLVPQGWCRSCCREHRPWLRFEK